MIIGRIFGKKDVLGCHEENTEHLTYATQSTRVNLRHIDGLCLKKLFKDHAVVRVLSRRDANVVGLEGSSNGGVAEDIIWSCRFLYEP